MFVVSKFRPIFVRLKIIIYANNINHLWITFLFLRRRAFTYSYTPRECRRISKNRIRALWKSPVCVTPKAQVPLTLESKFRMTPIKS